MGETINELNITEEAKFDYAFLKDLLVGDFGSDLPPNFRISQELVSEIELFLNTNKKVQGKYYLRLTHTDEFDQDLMLFITRGKLEENKQYWELKGITESSGWSEEAEENGIIRAWYETKVANITEKTDWVAEMYTYKIIDKLEEIYDIGGRDEYIGAREEVARKLSREQSDDRGQKEIPSRRVKYYLKKGNFSSGTADEIIGMLNRIADECRERADQQGI